MHKKIALAIFIYLVSLAIHAQDESKFSGSLLWKISGKDITKPSYILGSHHLANISFLDDIKGYKEAFDEANNVVGELDLRDKAALQAMIQQSIMIGEDEKKYKDLLTEEEYTELAKNLQIHLGVPIEAIETMKPTLITTMLALKLYTEVDPAYNPMAHKSIDEYVQETGVQAGKNIAGLETAQDQIDALYMDPIADQLNDLICTFKEMNLAKEAIVKLNELYANYDLNGMYDLSFDTEKGLEGQSSCPMSKEKKHLILDKRNNNWLEKLPTLFKADSNMIVVGALHLAGKEGLLSQLEKMGYTVEAVK